MKDKIAIISRSGDGEIAELVAAGRQLAADRLVHLELAIGPTVSFAMDSNRLELDRQSLLDCSRIFVQGFHYMDPIVPAPVVDADWSVWQQSHIVEQQRFSILYSVFAEAQRRGVRVYNSMSGLVLGFQPSEQLSRLQSNGFDVPAILVSNDDAEVARFREQFQCVIWRPSTGRAAWQLFTDLQNEHLVHVEKPPVLLAQVLEGPARWAYVLDEQVLFTHEMQPAAILPPESLEAVCGVTDGAAKEVVVAACRAVGLRWARVMYVEHDGGVWIYAIESNPLLSWLPAELRRYLNEALMRALLDLPGGAFPDALHERVLERPTLFLRRMLTILFDIEATKYPQAEGAEE